MLRVGVEPGMAVTKGDLICVVEAMKMENEITAHRAGAIASVDVAPGEVVLGDDSAVRAAESHKQLHDARIYDCGGAVAYDLSGSRPELGIADPERRFMSEDDGTAVHRADPFSLGAEDWRWSAASSRYVVGDDLAAEVEVAGLGARQLAR